MGGGFIRVHMKSAVGGGGEVRGIIPESTVLLP